MKTDLIDIASAGVDWAIEFFRTCDPVLVSVVAGGILVCLVFAAGFFGDIETFVDNAAFHAWLAKKERFMRYHNFDEARKAWKKERDCRKYERFTSGFRRRSLKREAREAREAFFKAHGYIPESMQAGIQETISRFVMIQMRKATDKLADIVMELWRKLSIKICALSVSHMSRWKH